MKALKITFLISLYLASFLKAYSQSQEYFYYYKGKKQILQLNTDYLYVVTSSEISSAEKLSSIIGENGLISKFSQASIALTLDPIAKSDTAPEYLAETQLKSKFSALGYLNYIAKLKKKAGIKVVAPYFKSKTENKIGLSHYFYVKLKSQDDFRELEKKALETETQIIGQNKFMPLWFTLKCTAKSSGNALQNANRFYESGLFEYAEPEFIIEDISHAPNDPEFANQWGINNTGLFGGTAGIDINALDAWKITKGARDVIVAVLDHGFEMNHPELRENTIGAGFDTGTGTSPAQVLGNHGTACAGIIGAIQDNNTGLSGVAPNTRLMSISNSLAATPATLPALKQQLADGINWAWQHGAHIISNSWGGEILVSSLIDDAITNALTNGRGGLGTIMVFSSGNSNSNVIYPANSNPDIIAVGASDDCGLRVEPLGEGSCLSWNTTQGSCFGNELDVVAPGAMIFTTDRQGSNGYTGTDYRPNFGGTSSACPMVAGVAALILSVNPCLTHDQVEDIIEQSAQKVGTYTYSATAGRPNGPWNIEMGYGLVDAQAAVQLAQAMLSPTPRVDLFSRDRPFDTGIEPNPDGGPMWISNDIWVRKNLDGGATHENPEYKLYSPNGIYVKVTNRGKQSSNCTNLSVYFTKASTGLVWPTHWTNYFQATSAGSILHGDKINTVLIPPLAPGASYTVEIPWFPPNPANFDSDIHHFCLLTRITSPADPMFDEQNLIGVGENVRKNNNIAWKNVSVYDLDSDAGLDAVSIFVRGVQKGWSKINLRFFDQGFQEHIRTRFFERGGTIHLQADPKFIDRIKEAKLYNVEISNNNTLIVTSPRAQIQSIPVYSKETFSLALNFKVNLEEKEETVLDVIQENSETGKLEGGERFIIKPAQGWNFENSHTNIAKRSSVVYPNPVKSEMIVKYKVMLDNSTVEISLQSLFDSKLKVNLFTGQRNSGDYQDKFNVQNLKKGLYVLTLKTGNQSIAEKVIIE